MDYEQFRVEHDKVWALLGEATLPQSLPNDIARLKEMAAAINDPADRRDADNMVAMIESIVDESLSAKDEEPWSDAMNEAIRVHLEASDDSGTPAERIARARAGIQAIGRIADRAPEHERNAIIEMNGSLLMLAEALEPDAE
ncbi:hypothetical protein GCM10029976_056340 [Kribbella albertanoniae]|uniref:Uncharacterized protein n=1 Tax=Kribbella albertanoniae TaxID=1266829 RepID=A0A4R4PRW8_9ACTN|nr:hypothetical protein [Kribbella albertanoniae]TDC25004.1 hypothetical protein E1261_25080 [Kribbella albertanoniae]